jgi:hypothetical protein
MVKMRTFLISLMAALALAACAGDVVEPVTPPTPDTGSQPTDGGEGETITGEAMVNSVQINMMESFPLQMSVTVSGDLPDGCTELTEPQQRREGDTFFITLPTERPADAMCTQALVPFEETISVDILGLEAGTYTVSVNGVEETFTLEQDNVMPEEDDQSGGAMPRDEVGGNAISYQTVEANADGRLTITGELPDGCTNYISDEWTLDGTTVNISLTRNVPADVMCTMAITPYTYTIELDGLTSGETYTVIVNGEEAATFTAEQ